MYPCYQKCFNSRFKVPELWGKKRIKLRLMQHTHEEPAKTGGGRFTLLIRSFFFLRFCSVQLENVTSLYPEIDFLDFWRFPCEDFFDYLVETSLIYTHQRCFLCSVETPSVKTAESPSYRSIATGFPPIASSQCTNLPHLLQCDYPKI